MVFKMKENERIMKRYKQLFFDLDHTLWDFESNARLSLEELFDTFHLKEKGIPSFESFHTTYFKHNEILWERYRKGFITQKELGFKRMWRVLLEYKIPDTQTAQAMNDLYMEVLPQKGKLMPGARDVLDFLTEKKYPLHIITNGPEKGQRQKLQTSGIAGYFQVIVTSESVGKPKPHPEIFRYALEKTGAKAEDVLMIGDAPEADVIGAKKMGMDTVFFNPKNLPLKEIQPSYIISDLSGLKKKL